MALQNPVTSGLGIPNSWTLLQFNFAQPLTNARAGQFLWGSIQTCSIPRTALITLRRRARRRR
jgi:hypothetical protein